MITGSNIARVRNPAVTSRSRHLVTLRPGQLTTPEVFAARPLRRCVEKRHFGATKPSGQCKPVRNASIRASIKGTRKTESAQMQGPHRGETTHARWQSLSDEELAERMLSGELDLFPASANPHALADLAAQKLMRCMDSSLVKLKVELRLLELGPAGASLCRARRVADTAAAKEDIRSRFDSAMQKLLNMEHDRVRKLQVLEVSGSRDEDSSPGSGSTGSKARPNGHYRPPMLYANNICTFNMRPGTARIARGGRNRRCDASTRVRAISALEVDEDVDEDRLRAKLERNEEMIEEAAADVSALMATEAFTHWHRRERSYMRQLVRSGIGPLRQELSKSLLQRGRTANLLGERFEALCAELVYELLLPSAKAELEQEAREGDAVSPWEGGEVLALNNVVLRCRMPRRATGEFDFMILRIAKEPLNLSGTCTDGAEVPEGASQAWPVEVVKVIECKSSARDIPGDIMVMQRAINFLTGMDLPEDVPSEFKAAVVPGPDGRLLLFTPQSFSRLKGKDFEDTGHNVVYIAREGPLGPGRDKIGQLMDKALSVPGFSQLVPGELQALSDAAERGEGEAVNLPVKSSKTLAGQAVAAENVHCTAGDCKDGGVEAAHEALYVWARARQLEEQKRTRVAKILLRNLVHQGNLWMLRRASSMAYVGPNPDNSKLKLVAAKQKRSPATPLAGHPQNTADVSDTEAGSWRVSQ